MTDRQIKESLRALPRLYKDYTPDEFVLMNELRCRQMINSIFAYDGVDAAVDSDGNMNRYLVDNGRYYSIGYNRVKELIDEQRRDFIAHTKVYRNYVTDSEGGTYNAVVWDDAVNED